MERFEEPAALLFAAVEREELPERVELLDRLAVEEELLGTLLLLVRKELALLVLEFLELAPLLEVNGLISNELDELGVELLFEP